MVGGIGDYNIECTPVLEILYRLNNYHVTSIWIWIYQMGGNKILIFIIPQVLFRKSYEHNAKGINAVVGTKLGYDKIRGNNLDNTFSLGSGGGVIYSGGGSNTYFVPATLQDNLHIYISEKSNGNHIILGDMHSRYLLNATLVIMKESL